MQRKKVFLSTETDQSYSAKVQYAIDQGAGGIMFWEMAGDYSTPTENGTSSYAVGSHLTDMAYNMLKTAAPYDNKPGDDNFNIPATTLDIGVDLIGYNPAGELNYPIQIGLELVNNSNVDLTNVVVEFNVSPATPLSSTTIEFIKPFSDAAYSVFDDADVLDLNGAITWGATNVATSGTGNVGGLPDGFHRYQLSMVDHWTNRTFAPGDRIVMPFRIFMPMTLPTNFTFKVGSTTYGRESETRNNSLEVVSPTGPTTAPTAEPSTGTFGGAWVGPTTAVNGTSYSYNGGCWEAQNSPGIWESPAEGWFWTASNACS